MTYAFIPRKKIDWQQNWKQMLEEQEMESGLGLLSL